MRVLDLTVVYAGPYLSMLLADLGAEVIRVENVHAWPTFTRGIRPAPMVEDVGAESGWPIGYPAHDPGEYWWERFPFGLPLHRNKKSVTINLKSTSGREYFYRLVAKCDVVVENNSPSAIDRLGVGYDELVKCRPDLVRLRAPAFGLSGSYREIKGFGSHIESFIGHSLLRGYEDADPTSNQEMNSGDNATAGTGVFAVLAALHHRDRTGKGQLVEVAQVENSAHLFPQAIMDFSLNRRVSSTKGNRDLTGLWFNGVFACRGDDRWLAVSAGAAEEWRALAGAIERPELADDPRFADGGGREAHREQAEGAVAAWCAGQDQVVAMYRLQAAGVAAGPVMDPRDGLESPQLWARGFWRRLHHRFTGTWEWPGPPFRLSAGDHAESLPPPGLGAHNEYVYREIVGVSTAEYAELVASGEIGTRYAPGAW